jgi:hypothetical protein
LSGAASSVAIAPHGFADQAPPRLGTLGVAYDGSAESEAALEGGRRLAGRAGARLRVITVHQRNAFGDIAASAISLESVNARLSASSGRAA